MKQYTKIAITIAISTFLFFSCVTEKGARRYMHEHELFAAQWCADKFPVIPTTSIDSSADSTKYKEAYLALARFADSLLRTKTLQLGQSQPAGGPARLTQAQADSIRSVISIELEKRLKPCVDKVTRITERVVDSAMVKALMLEVKEANAGKELYVNKYAAQVDETRKEAAAKRGWKIACISLAVLIGIGALLLLRRR